MKRFDYESEDRLAAADRENAELRAQLRDASDFNRGNCERANRAEMHADGLRRIRDKALAENAKLRGELAGAQATIEHQCEAMSWIAGHDRQGLDHLDEAMAAAERAETAESQLAATHVRLEAVRALAESSKQVGGFGRLNSDDVLAALSAAPQPEPCDSDAAEDAQADLVEGVLIHFADRLSERKAVETASVARRIVRVLNGNVQARRRAAELARYAAEHGPAASGTPDGGL